VQTDVLINTSRRGNELRYVTTHFRDLQGLRLVPLWVVLLALCALATSNSLPSWQLATAAFTSVVLSFGWLVWSKRWYERRFGVVTSPEQRIPSGIISILHPEPKPRSGNYSGVQAILFLLNALYIVPGLFLRSERHFEQFGLIALAFVVLPRCRLPASDSAWIRLRQVLSIAASILIFAIYLSYVFGRLGKLSYVPAICAILLSLDLYDHWLFTRLLSGSSADSYE
jgi:hypothetical protein